MPLLKSRKKKKVVKPKLSHFDTHYELIDRITSCQHGEVYTVCVKKHNNLMAGKIVNVVTNPFASQEFKINLSMDHPNVIKSIDNCKYTKSEFACVLKYELLIMEYANGGTLYHFLNDKNSGFDKNAIPNLVLQITNGLAYIHQRGYIHRDLKPSNILMVNGVPKIADFGLATAVASRKYRRFNGVLGTAAYNAPEMLCGIHYNKNYDVWSLGVIITVMVLGKNIFGIESWGLTSEDKYVYCLRRILEMTGVPEEKEFRQLRTSTIFMFANFPPLPPNKPCFLECCREILGDNGHDFLMKCLTVAPRFRYTSQQLLNHPYLTSFIIN